MTTDPLTDQTIARRLLERAVQYDQKPVLSTDEVDDLMLLATSIDADGDPQWTGSGLNGAAAAGWSWKAGKAVPGFTVALEDGGKFNREQIFDHCQKKQRAYLSGAESVLGHGRQRGTVGSIPFTSLIGEVAES